MAATTTLPPIPPSFTSGREDIHDEWATSLNSTLTQKADEIHDNTTVDVLHPGLGASLETPGPMLPGAYPPTPGNVLLWPNAAPPTQSDSTGILEKVKGYFPTSLTGSTRPASPPIEESSKNIRVTSKDDPLSDSLPDETPETPQGGLQQQDSALHEEFAHHQEVTPHEEVAPHRELAPHEEVAPHEEIAPHKEVTPHEEIAPFGETQETVLSPIEELPAMASDSHVPEAGSNSTNEAGLAPPVTEDQDDISAKAVRGAEGVIPALSLSSEDTTQKSKAHSTSSDGSTENSPTTTKRRSKLMDKIKTGAKKVMHPGKQTGQ
ncbi:hypothetical protein DL96DRAFT_1602242 [Flagelloscypha sp. PMI_526]|nr:hypothetical protein DL96DRAFT_1602242 [Flagelloscypha sp. PMI_526]